jgi:hypothetical protein
MSFFAQISYTGNSSTTSFAIPFSFIDQTHIEVFLNGTSTSAFTISSSTLTFSTAPATGVTILIKRNTPKSARLVDFIDGSVLTEADLDRSADQNFYIAQEVVDDGLSKLGLDTDDKYNANSKVIKNLASPVADTDAVNKAFISTNLPNINTVAGIAANVTTVAGISGNVTTVANNNADVSTVATNIASVNTAATNIAAINTVNTNIADIITTANDLNEAVSEIDTVANSIANVNTVGTAIANVNTVATDIANVNSVAGNSTNINAVASNATNINAVNANSANINAVNANSANINTVAGNNSNITTVAGISANVTAVAGDATDIGTVATDLAGSDTIGTVATDIANVNLVGGSIANVNTVATNVANVNTVAGNNANINTVAGQNANITTLAGISADITTVATNAGNISTVATDIAKVITTANDLNEAVSEIDTVANAIANVDTVGTNIANVNLVGGSIANVNTVGSNIGTVNEFGQRYRVSGTAPSTSLDLGDLYFDTASNTMKVYSSGGWINAGSSVNGTADRFKYTATASQTTFTGTDDNSNTLAYDAGFLDVYLNGIKLVNGSDFTASSGTSIVLAVGASASDILEVIAYGTFQLANFSIADANDVPPIGTAGQVLKVNSGATALEYGTIDLTNLNATNLTSGTLPDARFPATLPATSGANLTSLNASNLSSGTVPSARLSLTSSDLPTVPTTKGGTGLTTIGTAGQALKVNSGGTALEFGTISSYTDTDALDLFNASGSAPVYACRAWVNFNGTGTVTIRASGNVSSITDNGTGNYTVNFTTAMPNVNYAFTTAGIFAGSGEYGTVVANAAKAGATSLTRNTTSIRIGTQSGGNGAAPDAQTVDVAIFR